jgi:DNA repair photolyase
MNKNKDKFAHGTGEWAEHNVNIQHGCGNRCMYCYASAMAIRFGRKTAANWRIPEVDLAKVDKRYGRKSGRIMFPTSHDIDEDNIGACAAVLKKMLASGNDVLIVSKPRLSCVKQLCIELAGFKGQVMFRFTIGSADDAILKAWEPGAPAFAERIASLKYAHGAGFRTSVSCEPMLDARIDMVIRKARTFVTDSIWLGRANQLKQIVAVNRPGDARAKAMAEFLLATITDEHIRGLYARYRNEKTVIKWKDSLKKILGIERPMQTGLDV